MSTLSELISAQALATEAFENIYRPGAVEFRMKSPPGGGAGRENGCDGYEFTLRFERLGAALLPLTWIACALYQTCAPFDQIDLHYSSCGGLVARFHVGCGAHLSDSFRSFITRVAMHPRIVAFEWNLEVLPDYSRIAAAALVDANNFQNTGMAIRTALLARKSEYVPEFCVPCAQVTNFEFDSAERAQVRAILSELRAGTTRRALSSRTPK